MKIKTTYRVIGELALLTCGIVLYFMSDFYWAGEIFGYLGLSLLVLDITNKKVRKNKDIKTLAIVFSIFTALNLLRHWYVFHILTSFEILSDLEFDFFLIREIIWLIPTILMVLISFKLVKNKGKTDFDYYIKTKELKLVVGFILIAIFLELPIFGIHPDFIGGSHGHGFWDAWSHIH